MTDAPATLSHFVHGKEVAGTSGRFGDVFDPATGQVTGKLPLASKQEVEAAIAVAQAAFPAWAQTTPLNRARVMFKFKALLEQHADEIALAITREHGKVLSDARGELTRGIEVVEFACGIPQLLKGEHSMNVGSGVDSYSEYAPLGVVAGITPFNFPCMVPMWMFPIAIACGNTFILKPSERDPTPPMILARLLQASRPARWRLQRRAWRQGSGGHAAGRPARAGGELRRLDADRRVPVCARQRGRQTHPGPGRRQEPHGGDARRGHGAGRQCAAGRRLRLGRRALHGDFGRGLRRRCHGRCPRRETQADGRGTAHRARAARAIRTWARW